MEQFTIVASGMVIMATLLAVLGLAASIFGADSRPCVGDSHTDTPRTDWI